jgi:hypothetical protein
MPGDPVLNDTHSAPPEATGDTRSDFLCMGRLSVLTGMSGNPHLEDFASYSNLDNLADAGECSGQTHDVAELLLILSLYMEAEAHSNSTRFYGPSVFSTT